MRLRTGSCDDPGCRSLRCGRGFRCADDTGEPLAGPEQLARIGAPAIPPAWCDVWICPWPGGRLQAVGTDDAGRRQYLCHRLGATPAVCRASSIARRSSSCSSLA
ncbi:hypothetical protein ACIHEJ_00650 [Streptomyces sp. NPDC052301]|uniref:hypothetical protein n=1 Tax=Streptomyces sp. NPDC052301 TaxID=3365687 RepID=UPI0037D40729